MDTCKWHFKYNIQNLEGPAVLARTLLAGGTQHGHCPHGFHMCEPIAVADVTQLYTGRELTGPRPIYG